MYGSCYKGKRGQGLTRGYDSGVEHLVVCWRVLMAVTVAWGTVRVTLKATMPG